MEYTALIIVIALVQYLVFGTRAGINRGKYDVKAPSTTGHEIWERMYRVQMNTMEQLVIFIPGMVLFSTYISDFWVLVPGVMFVVGRQLYSYEYVKDPDSRVPGMTLSGLSNAILLLGSFLGIILKMV